MISFIVFVNDEVVLSMSNKVDYKILQFLDYVIVNKPKGYNVSLTINTNDNYQINFIKENNEQFSKNK